MKEHTALPLSSAPSASGATPHSLGANKLPQQFLVSEAVDAAIDKGLVVEIGQTAVVQAIVSGVDGMVREGSAHMDAFKKGEIEGTEIAVKVIRTGAQKAAAGGAKTAMALGLKEGVREISKRMGWRGLWRASIRHSHVFTAVAFGVIDQGWSTVKWANGQIDGKAYQLDTAQNLGATGGAIGGAAAGAMLGSVIPGVGTTLGTVLGAYLGSHGGSIGGRSFLEKWMEEENQGKSSGK